MYLSELAVTKPVSVLMGLLFNILLGVVSFYFTNFTLLPSLKYPGLSVTVEYYGISPDKMEQIISKHLEQALSRTGGIKNIFSVSEEGKSRINLEFSREVDFGFKTMEVREKVDLIASSFPREVQTPVIHKYDSDNHPFIILTFHNREGQTMNALREEVERSVKPLVESVEGVAEVIVVGGEEQEIVIDLDRSKMEAFGIPMQLIQQRISAANIALQSGQIQSHDAVVTLFVDARFKNLEDIKKTSILNNHNSNFILADIARVYYGSRDSRTTSRMNGVEKIGMYIYRGNNENLSLISKAIRTKLDGMNANVPYAVVYDKSLSQDRVVFNYVFVYILAIVIVSLCLLVFYSDYRYAVLFNLVWLSAMLSVYTLLFLLQKNMDMIAFSGVILGNVFLLFKIGKLTQHGYVRSTRLDVFTSLMYLLVFLPFLYISSEMYILYSGFVLVFGMFSVLSVLYLHVAYVFLFSRLRPVSFNKFSANVGKNLYNKYTNYLAGKKILVGIFKNKSISYLLMLLSVILIFTANSKQMRILQENEVFAQLDMPSGTSYIVTNEVSLQIEKKLMQLPFVEKVDSRVEKDHATYMIRLNDWVALDEDFYNNLQQTLKTEKGFVHIDNADSSSFLDEITVNVYGDDLSTIDRYIRDFISQLGKLDGVFESVLKYKSPREELQLVVAREDASRLGVTSDILGSFLRMALQGGVTEKFVASSREIDVRLKYRKSDTDSVEKIKNLRVPGNNHAVPVQSLVQFDQVKIPLKIYRKNKKRMNAFSLKVKRSSYEYVLQQIEALKNSSKMPENYYMELDESIALAMQNSYSLGLAMLASLSIIFMLLASCFESLKSSIYILLKATGYFLFINAIAILFAGGWNTSVFIGILVFALLAVLMHLNPDSQLQWSDNEFTLFLLCLGYLLPFLVFQLKGLGLVNGYSFVLFGGICFIMLVAPVNKILANCSEGA